VSESIEGGRTQESVRKSVVPFVEVEIACNDGGGSFVSLGYEVVEVFVVRRGHRFESEVIDNEQRSFDKSLEPSFVSVDSPSGVELSKQLGLCGEEDVVAVSDSNVSEGLCDVAFSRAARPDDQNGDLLFDEAAGGEVLDKRLVNVWVKSERGGKRGPIWLTK